MNGGISVGLLPILLSNILDLIYVRFYRCYSFILGLAFFFFFVLWMCCELIRMDFILIVDSLDICEYSKICLMRQLVS